jgi:hypothetical protein
MTGKARGGRSPGASAQDWLKLRKKAQPRSLLRTLLGERLARGLALESKRQPGLYFIGEVVDVTGWLGGFNFQWAWSSGHAAGQFV